ncbi:hypothetical protein QAD02_011697 [Eretmocerus hayati]|uniref:Uncharacterized protein n=1 Tax=Eretmocerus hayati TaxID=131215 RepID=A0ACC2NZA0_9HYME|nr:hypothetical protein QAD02_011697 [Eretmocerus hayati]
MEAVADASNASKRRYSQPNSQYVTTSEGSSPPDVSNAEMQEMLLKMKKEQLDKTSSQNSDAESRRQIEKWRAEKALKGACSPALAMRTLTQKSPSARKLTRPFNTGSPKSRKVTRPFKSGSPKSHRNRTIARQLIPTNGSPLKISRTSNSSHMLNRHERPTRTSVKTFQELKMLRRENQRLEGSQAESASTIATATGEGPSNDVVISPAHENVKSALEKSQLIGKKSEPIIPSEVLPQASESSQENQGETNSHAMSTLGNLDFNSINFLENLRVEKLASSENAMGVDIVEEDPPLGAEQNPPEQREARQNQPKNLNQTQNQPGADSDGIIQPAVTGFPGLTERVLRGIRGYQDRPPNATRPRLFKDISCLVQYVNYYYRDPHGEGFKDFKRHGRYNTDRTLRYVGDGRWMDPRSWKSLQDITTPQVFMRAFFTALYTEEGVAMRSLEPEFVRSDEWHLKQPALPIPFSDLRLSMIVYDEWLISHNYSDDPPDPKVKSPKLPKTHYLITMTKVLSDFTKDMQGKYKKRTTPPQTPTRGTATD